MINFPPNKGLINLICNGGDAKCVTFLPMCGENARFLIQNFTMTGQLMQIHKPNTCAALFSSIKVNTHLHFLRPGFSLCSPPCSTLEEEAKSEWSFRGFLINDLHRASLRSPLRQKARAETLGKGSIDISVLIHTPHWVFPVPQP